MSFEAAVTGWSDVSGGLPLVLLNLVSVSTFLPRLSTSSEDFELNILCAVGTDKDDSLALMSLTSEVNSAGQTTA